MPAAGARALLHAGDAERIGPQQLRGLDPSPIVGDFDLQMAGLRAGADAQVGSPGMPHGAWPMVLPMVAAGAALMAIAFGWLPRLYPARMR